MEREAFERPREKIQTRGVRHLTTTELLQVILGSGSIKASGARLAKRVAHIVATQKVSYAQLLGINGIGVAKACQVLAALELGRRMAEGTEKASLPSIPPSRLQRLMAKHRKSIVVGYFFNGAEQEILERHYAHASYSSIPLIVKQIAADALSVNARSVIVAIGSKSDALRTTTNELELIKRLKDSLLLISVRIVCIYRANAKTVEQWSDI